MSQLHPWHWAATHAQAAAAVGIILLVQSTILIALGLLAARIAARNSAAARSAVLRAVLLAVIVCPIAAKLLDRAGIAGVRLNWRTDLPQQASAHTVWFIAVAIASAISVVLLTRLAVALRMVRRIRQAAASAPSSWIEDAGRCARVFRVTPPPVLLTEYFNTPCLVGCGAPAILLPMGSASLRSEVLVHELAHVRRRDCLWQLLARAAAALLWFQPLIWVLVRRLEQAADEACDDFVVAYGSDRADYAHQLVDMAERHQASWIQSGCAVSMATMKSSIARRVVRIMDGSRGPSAGARRAALVMVVVIFGIGAGAALFFQAGVSASAADVSGSDPRRLPVPDAAALAKAEKLVRDAFGNYPSTPLKERPAVAAKLLQNGIDTHDNDAGRYALLKDAMDLAAGAGDAAIGMKAADQLANLYAVNGNESRLEVVRKAAQSATAPAAAQAVAEIGLQCADEAAAAGDYETAMKFLAPTEAAAHRMTPLLASIQTRTNEIRWMYEESMHAKIAEGKRLKNADDPDANLALGRFHCIVRMNWKQGLPELLKGSNPAFRAAAANDLSSPTHFDKQVAAGDLWWDLAEKEQNGAQSALRRRAAYWYTQAVADSQFSGLQRMLAEKRLRQAPPPTPKDDIAGVTADSTPPMVSVAPAAAPGDLVACVKLPTDIVEGPWTRGPDGLTSAGDRRGARIKLLSNPPAEYDLRIAFTMHGEHASFGALLAHNDASGMWKIDFGDSCRFRGAGDTAHMMPEKIVKIEPRLTINERHEAVIKVRSNSISTFIDGKPMGRITEDYSQCRLEPYWSIGNHAIGLGNGDTPVTFHIVELTSISNVALAEKPPAAPGAAPAGKLPLADWETIQKEPAQVTMARYDPRRLTIEDDPHHGWKTVPAIFQRYPATIYDLKQAKKSGNVDDGISEFEVTQAGYLLLACNWSNQGNRSGGWADSRLQKEDLIRQGWLQIDDATLGGTLVSNDASREQTLFMRHVLKGEKYSLRCNKYYPPYVILLNGAGTPTTGSVPSRNPSPEAPRAHERGKTQKIPPVIAEAATIGGPDVLLTVDEMVTVGEHGSLTLLPGTRVEFAAKCGITVTGVLHAIGEHNLPISFVARDAAAGWEGIDFTRGGPASQMSWCITTGAECGTKIYRDVKIDHCLWTDNQVGIQIVSSTGSSFTDSLITASRGDGVIGGEDQHCKWTNVTISNCGGVGYHGTFKGWPVMKQCAIVDNRGGGMWCEKGGGTGRGRPEVSDSNISGNGVFDIWCHQREKYDFDRVFVGRESASALRQNASATVPNIIDGRSPKSQGNGIVSITNVRAEALMTAGAPKDVSELAKPLTSPPPAGGIFGDEPPPGLSKEMRDFAAQRNALPADKQFAATLARLKETNGGNDIRANFHADKDGAFQLDIPGQDALVSVEALYGMHITRLNLGGNRHLKNLNGLQEMPLAGNLTFDNCSALSGDLSALKGMQLTQLSFGWCGHLQSLNGVQGMPLKRLNLCGCGALENDLSALKGTELSYLCLYACDQLKNLDGLRGTPLKELILSGNPSKAKAESILQIFPTLESLKTGNAKLDEEMTAEIARRKGSQPAATAPDRPRPAAPGANGPVKSIFSDTPDPGSTVPKTGAVNSK